MEKILSQEEIDQLFRSAQGQMAEKPKAATAARACTPCNLRQSARISKDQLRSVSQLHETFARSLTHSLGAYLRAPFEANLVSTEQLSYGEFLQRIPEATYLVCMTVRPVGASAAVELDLPLAFPMIDLLLGGPGRAEATVREITEIEEQILESVMKVIERELEATWHSVLEVQFSLEQRVQQAEIPRLMPPNEKILSLSFEVRMPEARGMLNVALPAAVSNALLRKLTQQGAYRKQRSAANSAVQISNHLQEGVFSLELVLPEKRVRVAQLLALEPGNILHLRCPPNEPANLLVSGKKLFGAYPVRAGTRRAAQVSQRVHGSDSAPKEKA